MKLAEALILRADCQKRFEQLKTRILANAKVQEGDEPAEQPRLLIDEMEKVSAELLNIVARINKTNSATQFEGARSLSDALAERDNLMLRRGVYSQLATAASVVQSRATRSEVKYKSTVSVRDIQEEIDKLSMAYRNLDSNVQQLNWSVDLLD